MGNFYTNISIRAPQSEVRGFLAQQGRRAYISPVHNGFTVVYDALCDEQDTDQLSEVAGMLSRQFDAPALVVLNHDDDILWFQAYNHGKLVTDYNSLSQRRVSVFSLGRTFGVPGLVPWLWVVLHWPWFVFELWRHSLLVRTLGLPKWSVGGGYRYISQGEAPPALAVERLTHTP